MPWSALGLEHTRLMVAALAAGDKFSLTAPGRRLLQFRKEIATRNVVNVYWLTYKEQTYRLVD